ncbi:MAG: hypothetical protein CMA15_00600 [Euryarchaeota archaeon]|nr:hypothetical protein [Euryarchaeota archaeon]
MDVNDVPFCILHHRFEMSNASTFTDGEAVSPLNLTDAGWRVFILANDFWGKHAFQNLCLLEDHRFTIVTKRNRKGTLNGGQEALQWT